MGEECGWEGVCRAEGNRGGKMGQLIAYSIKYIIKKDSIYICFDILFSFNVEGF